MQWPHLYILNRTHINTHIHFTFKIPEKLISSKKTFLLLSNFCGGPFYTLHHPRNILQKNQTNFFDLHPKSQRSGQPSLKYIYVIHI
jgi:hypothetical protein